MFVETAAYSKMMTLHKSFTESIYLRPSHQNVDISERRITAAVQLFNAVIGNPIKTLPYTGWTVQALIVWSEEGSVMTLDRVFTHPLDKKEIDRALKGKQCEPSLTSIEIYLHDTLLTPKSRFSYTLDQFPDTIIIPASGGIAMSVDCQSNLDEIALNFAFTCVPKKYTVGQLTCAMMSNSTDPDAVAVTRDHYYKPNLALIQLW